MTTDQFSDCFKHLTGNFPFPWQEELYCRFIQGVERIPANCAIPTGLGKTSVIAVWLIALATPHVRVPRRLAYVVNRRTVVDQTTAEVEKLRTNLDEAELASLKRALGELCALPTDCPLAVSTLRGAFADNREWSADPCRPAVVVGTVDLIGSRLLFSGYRAGYKTRPLYAGLLGQDTLIVHDEAHLEPAFQTLLEAIREEQSSRQDAPERDKRRVVVMQLSATTRGKEPDFALTPTDMAHPDVNRRLCASKRLVLHPLADPKKLADKLSELALTHKDSGKAVLVFARSVETVEKVATNLQAAKCAVRKLTGTMRGHERDSLVETPEFQRLLPASSRTKETAQGTVYLVCTSAGEVGVNLSADHLVCDLATFENMTQRLGRVNRFGDCVDTRVDVVHPDDSTYSADLRTLIAGTLDLSNLNEDKRARLLDERALARTLALLKRLNGAVSPASLLRLQLTEEERKEAFSVEPEILTTSSILFDAWALTSIRDSLPSRPPVEPYLHGKSEIEPPTTEVAWREEVGVITDGLLAQYPPEDLLAQYPLKPAEILRDRSDRVWKHLDMMAQRNGAAPLWIVDDGDHVETLTLNGLSARRERSKDCINGRTLLLDPVVGGLNEGVLAGGSLVPVQDVADSSVRLRIWDGAENPEMLEKMQLIREIRVNDDLDGDAGNIDTTGEDPESSSKQVWRWYELPAQADTENSRYASGEILLKDHTGRVEAFARTFAEKLSLPPEMTEAVGIAGRFHDYGKDRRVWQQSIGNFDDGKVLAKSDGRRSTRGSRTNYRHEFGSLLDLSKSPEFKQISDAAMRDVILHLIAAHHGRGRPHFSPVETDDLQHSRADADALAAETPRRFARLQRRFGRWGLAFLESLLRAADYAASANPLPAPDEKP